MSEVTCGRCRGLLTLQVAGDTVLITARVTIGDPATADAPPSELTSAWCSTCIHEMNELIS